MHIDKLKNSKFLAKGDVEPDILVTIRGLEHLNVAMEGAPEELKYCVTFEEQEKPMVLNNINAQIIAKITGSADTDGWGGHKIVLFNDPNVSFGGKLTGGIRVRAPRKRATASPAPQPEPPQTTQEAADDDLPF